MNNDVDFANTQCILFFINISNNVVYVIFCICLYLLCTGYFLGVSREKEEISYRDRAHSGFLYDVQSTLIEVSNPLSCK